MTQDLGELPPATGFPGQVAQVVVNLVVNAADSAPEAVENEVTVRTRLVGAEVKLSVADRGAGMTDEVRAQLFKPFMSTKPAGKGTGLGLSVVQQIVRRHRGRIEVDSAPGKGTTMTVWLPLQPGLALLEDAKTASVGASPVSAAEGTTPDTHAPESRRT